VDPSWIVLIFSNIVNGCFEELTVMGYAFNQFAAKRGPLFALVSTTFLRLLYHTWKQPAYLLETGIAFLIFGVFYWRTRKLWPLILAHVSFDILWEPVVKLVGKLLF
jgi:membrane protease YdiL (CAAX protease family)